MDDLPHWRVAELRAIDSDGRNQSWRSFSQDGWAGSQLFIRELIQNTLDSRVSGSDQAMLIIRIIDPDTGLDENLMRRLLDDLRPHLKKEDLKCSLEDASPRALIVEEEGTTGFTGRTDYSRDDGNFASFFFGAARENKKQGKNGRAGVGKLTYHMVSDSRSLLVISRRHDDEKLVMMGKCVFEHCHEIRAADGQLKHYGHNGFWSDWNDGQPLPFEDEGQIGMVSEAFGLERARTDPGTTFIIPFPDGGVQEERLILAVLQEFFFPILRGRLSVQIGSIVIDRGTVLGLIEKYENWDGALESHDPPPKPHVRFLAECIGIQETAQPFEAVRPYAHGEKIDAAWFDEGRFDQLVEQFDSGKTIWVRLPIEVTEKRENKTAAALDIFMSRQESYPGSWLTVMRQDLFIAQEMRGNRPKSGHSIFGLVLSEEGPLDDFLANAETPSHLQFNGSEPKLVERYSNPYKTLRSVRSSFLAVFNALSQIDEEEDTSLLADIIAVPEPTERKKMTSRRTKKKSPKVPRPDPPNSPLRHRYIDVRDIEGGIRFSSGVDAIPEGALPVTGYLEFGYVQASGRDPFKQYHHLDFDLADGSMSVQPNEHITVDERDGNRVEFVITGTDFELEVKGFLPDRVVKARARVREI